jgi:hypothetical protein
LFTSHDRLFAVQAIPPEKVAETFSFMACLISQKHEMNQKPKGENLWRGQTDALDNNMIAGTDSFPSVL